jgi:hypothetical protein
MCTHIYRKLIAVLIIIFITHHGIAKGLPEKVLPLIIDHDTFLSNDTLWILDGKCYVTNNATLVIHEGARIEAVKKRVASDASALIITRGARLYATATSSDPIVFTSREAIPNPGDWAGIILLGNAPVSQLSPDFSKFLPSVPAGVDLRYGGSDPHDMSGELQYVRIEYGGTVYDGSHDLKGLFCLAVGDATVLDYIEVAYSYEDAFQFYGGTVNAYHLFALAPRDAAFSFDYGYRGNIQYAVSLLRNTLTYSSNPNGIESQNDWMNSSSTPFTKPVISNMTVIGLQTSSEAFAKGIMNAALCYRTSAFDIRNSIFMGFPAGLYHNGSNADKNFCHNIVQAFATVVNPSPFPAATCAASTNITFTGSANDNISLINPFGSTPDFRPTAGSPAVTNATDFTGLPAFFQHVSYRGAFPVEGQDNWLEGWTKYEY